MPLSVVKNAGQGKGRKVGRETQPYGFARARETL